MDFEERSRIVRRINSKKLYGSVEYKYELYNIIFTDPTLDLLTEADWIYNKTYKDSVEKGAMTLEESYDILKSDGKWSDDKDDEIKTIRKDIEILSEELTKLKFHKLRQKIVKETIDKGEKRLTELINTKNQLWPSTAEFIAERSKKRFIISKITNLTDQYLLSLPDFLDTLAVYYYDENYISSKSIRKIARTDPWRLYWLASKNSGTSLFPSSSVEMTELQYTLLLWTKIYDFAYESMNRPPDDIIDDDYKFDAWYKEECNRINKEIHKNSVDNSLNAGNIAGGCEVFIPADQEGAKEVYELNDYDAKRRIQERQKALEQNGSLSETDLPDIKKDIRIELNRLASEAIQRR